MLWRLRHEFWFVLALKIYIHISAMSVCAYGSIEWHWGYCAYGQNPIWKFHNFFFILCYYVKTREKKLASGKINTINRIECVYKQQHIPANGFRLKYNTKQENKNPQNSTWYIHFHTFPSKCIPFPCIVSLSEDKWMNPFSPSTKTNRTFDTRNLYIGGIRFDWKIVCMVWLCVCRLSMDIL